MQSLSLERFRLAFVSRQFAPLLWRKGRLAFPKGEGEGEGYSMRVVCLRTPSPHFSPLPLPRGEAEHNN
jgi:hypothetical protein